jgi:putative NIF3 family GTP cyclohydrolase 1 type 2
MTAADIAARIRSALKAPSEDQPTEGFCAGNPATAVDSVVVCFSPTVAVVNRCVAEKKQFIISREHPFYLHGWSPAQPQSENWSARLPQAQKDDDATSRKRALLDEHGIVVYRLFSAWDAAKPSAQAAAFARALQLQPEPSRAGTEAETVYANLPRTTLEQLAARTAIQLNAPALRVTGDPNLHVSRAAVMHGLTGVLSLAKAIRDPKVDAVILGETCEWEATPYFMDVIASGRRVGMILAGYESSEDPGGAEVARWLQSSIPGLSAVWWKDSEPCWIPWPAKQGAAS